MPTLRSWLAATPTLRGAFLLGLLVGLVFLPFRMTPDYLLGHTLTDTERELHNGTDRLKDLAGAYYYAQEDGWHFPIFKIEKMGEPDGTSAVYTDSIPIAALALRLVNLVHPVLFNYFGPWVALCFALNPAFFCWLLYELGVRNRWALLAGAVLAACVPALIFRHGHAALCAHFLIIAALALYARRRAQPTNGKLIAAFAALIIFTLLVNVYLLVLVWAVYFAYLVQAAWDQRLTPGKGFYYFGATLALCLAVMFICGHLSLDRGVPLPGWGYGIYTMNVLSPFWPRWTAFAPAAWDFYEPTGGMYEGYNYLGAGVILLLLVHLHALGSCAKGLLRHHGALIAVFVILTVAAISDRVYVGPYVIFDERIGWFDHFMANFRSSGRLFWPVPYALMALLVAWTLHRFSPKVALGLLAGAALLQVYDTHTFARAGTQPQPDYVRPANIAYWEDLVGHFRKINVYPFTGTAIMLPLNVLGDYVAARKNLPINTAYCARPQCDDPAHWQAEDHPQFAEHELYLFSKAYYTRERVAMLAENCPWPVWEGADCYLLSSDFTPEMAAASGGRFHPAPAAQFRQLAPGHEVDFRNPGDESGLGYTGIYPPESFGSWSRNDVAEILTGLDPALRGQTIYLRFEIIPWVNDLNPQIKTRLEVNGREVGHWQFQPPMGQQVLAITAKVPAELTQSGMLRCQFTIEGAACPQTLGAGDDPRMLGLGFIKMAVAASPPKP